MATLQTDCPDELLTLPGLNADALEAMAREALLVRLDERGHISSGWAADVLGLSRRAFLDRLGAHGVSIFGEDVDLGAEARYGRS